MSKQKKCRTCMRMKSNYVSLFGRNLSIRLMKLADVQVAEGDGLPTTICEDCETDLEKCYEFRAQVQWADKKFREDRSRSEVLVEESVIKQEHVDVLMDCLNCHNTGDDQEEILIDEHLKDINEPECDPLNCVKDEIVAMDADEPSTPSSSVNGTVLSASFPIPPTISGKPKKHFEMDGLQQKWTPNTVVAVHPGLNITSNVEVPTCFITSSGNFKEHINNNSCNMPITTMSTNVIDSSWIQTSSNKGITTLSNPFSFLSNAYSAGSFLQTDSSVVHGTELNISKFKKKVKKKLNNILSNKSVISTKDEPLLCHNAILEDTNNSKNNVSISIAHADCNSVMKAVTSSCSVCNIDFPSVDLLNEHKEGKDFICRVCTTEFENHNGLEDHFLSHTSYKCKGCKKLFYSKKDLLQHKITTTTCNMRTGCEFCGKQFLYKHSLKSHKIIFHSSSGVQYKCVVCEKAYHHSQTWKDHMIRVHCAYEFLECKFCHNFYLGPEKLKFHIKAVHLQRDDENPFICSICGKVFQRKVLLISHQNIHSDITHVCEICGKSIKGKLSMTYHIKYEHSNTGSFTCDLCSKQYNTKEKLKKHVSRTHRSPITPATPFYCEICGKAYKSAPILKNHLKMHSDEKPFKCDICGATFKWKVVLRTHSRIHTGVAKYCCKVCGMSFRWKQTFDKHVKKCKVTDVEEKADSPLGKNIFF